MSAGDKTAGGPPPPAPTSGSMAIAVPFSKGMIYVNIKVYGETMRPDHLRRVVKYLELAQDDWGQDDPAGEQRPSHEGSNPTDSGNTRH